MPVINRRRFIASAGAAVSLRDASSMAATGQKRMGLVVHSYWKRWQGKFSSTKHPPFVNALDLLDHCREIGAAGLQVGVDGWTRDFAGKVRDTRESYDLYLEGSIALPKSEGDVARFDKSIRMGREAGATVFRSATGGRRYELFSRLEEFKAFKDQAWRSMQLAAPVAQRHGVRIGIENHKDFEAAELADMLRKLSSENIGACIDTGNSMALLEDPVMTVETLAPFVVTTHVKDMAVQESDDGFLLSEVPLGEGILDLPKLLQMIEKALPSVTFNLEMITRDPLHIPCLSEKYWATFPDKPGSQLAAMLATVKKRKAPTLPSVSDKSNEGALAYEEENILKSLRHGGEKLGLHYTQTQPQIEDKHEK
jgi:3-oxoisoapionate decarboxylase